MVDYQWKPDMKLVASYRFLAASTEWDSMAVGSMRGHNATAAERKDKVHTVSIGLGKAF